MTELHTIAYILGGAVFVLSLVIFGLALTIAEMKQRLNVLWRARKQTLPQKAWGDEMLASYDRDRPSTVRVDYAGGP